MVVLGSLDERDVSVELAHGPVGADGGLAAAAVVPMAPAGPEGDGGVGRAGALRYRATFSCEQAGRYGFTVRVVPSHEDLASATEMGLAAWA